MAGGQNGSLRGLRHGQHVCVPYEDPARVVDEVAACVVAGLVAGDRVLVVLGEPPGEPLAEALRRADVDVRAATASGGLVTLQSWTELPGVDATDPDALYAAVGRQVARALASGFAGLRVVADMSWTLGVGISHEALERYEHLGNQLPPRTPVAVVCLYDRRRLSTASCASALRAHPELALDGQLAANPYFERAEVTSAADRVDWRLARARRLRRDEEHRCELALAEAARVAAEAAVRARDHFIAVAAHELRTPLTSLRVNVDFMARRLAQGHVPAVDELEELLAVLQRQCHRQEQLIARLLDVSHLDLGRPAVSPQPCDVAQVVRDTLVEAAALSPEHAWSLRAPERLRAVVDPLRLGQILQNLLDNAVKHGAGARPVEVSLTAAEGEYELAVRDHGPGIPAAERQRVFERYHQLWPASGGMGLGLYITRELVRLHGGDIQVESPDGGGARLVVTLPVDGRGPALG